MRTRYNLSSANIFIEMPTGHPVGYITDLSINTSMNQQQIKNLRSEGIQSYVKGYTVNSVSASRAIIDGETFFGNYKQIYDYVTNASNLLKNTSNIASSILSNEPAIQLLTNAVDTAYSLGVLQGNDIDYRELIDSFEKLTKRKISLAEFWAKIPFTIVAKTSVPKQVDSFSLENFLNNSQNVDGIKSNTVELWRLDNCFLNSRSIKLSTNDVIVMENLEIFSTKFTDKNIVDEILSAALGTV